MKDQSSWLLLINCRESEH